MSNNSEHSWGTESRDTANKLVFQIFSDEIMEGIKLKYFSNMTIMTGIQWMAFVLFIVVMMIDVFIERHLSEKHHLLLIIVTALISISLFLMAFYFWLLRPLKKILLNIERLSSSDFTQGIESEGPVELKRMVSTINQLQRSIHNTISEYKIAQENLGLSEERLNTAQEMARIGNWVSEIDTGKLYWSRQMYRMHGLDESLEPPDYEKNLSFYTEDAKALLQETVALALTQGRSFSLELSMIQIASKPDLPQWVHSMCNAIINHEGKVIRLEGAVQDITLKKRLEKELYVQAERLKTAKDEADAANKAKSDFLASMSHEIRTPLNAILGFSQLMERQIEKVDNQVSPSQFKKYLVNITTSALHLNTLISDILELSRIESGQMTLHAKNVELYILLQEIEQLFRMEFERKQLDYVLSLDVKKVPLMLYTDRGKLKQIITNLLGNACKFTPSGKRIDLILDTHAENLIITVKDTGIGIPDDKQKEIFDAFVQVDQSNTRNYGGTGLGLAITKNLTEFLGGNISVKSKLDEGSIFTVQIPIKHQS